MIGYLNLQGKTQEVLMVIPFRSTGDVIRYQTGVCARYRMDGIIKFLCRIDDQMKVHGYCVEPGSTEVEISSRHDVKVEVVVIENYTYLTDDVEAIGMALTILDQHEVSNLLVAHRNILSWSSRIGIV